MPTPTHTLLDARVKRERHQNDLRLLLDAFERDIKTRLPQYAEKVIKRAREEVQLPFESFLAKVEAIRTSGRYTGDGEQAEVRLAARALQEKLAAVRANTVTRLEVQLAEKRRDALKPKTEPDPAMAVVQELKRRELRDHLRTLDPLQLQARIRQAVNDNADTDLLDALEGAPVGFPIVPIELVHEARAAIAERDHPELGELAQLRDAYTYVLGIAEQTLLRATGGDALALDVTQPTVDTRKPFLVGTGEPAPEVTT